MNSVLQKLGRYLILGEIAQGGMAVIYRGKLLGAAGFEKSVAIKKILPFWSQNQEFIGMLIDEAKILVEMHHPNIVQVFELGQEDDAYYIVMEYVNGFDLRTLVKLLSEKQHELPAPLIAFITKQICLGLDFAHNRTDAQNRNLNLVHRDISPQNILVGSHGEVKITDFGIAKTTQKTTQTQTGVVKGKFAYMSPEQVLGEEIDHQSDVFALGALLFELVCGHKAFDGKNDFEIIEKVKRAEILWPEHLCPELLTILKRALSAKKTERYADALAFYTDLEIWETTFAKKAQARDLKEFLNTHFSDWLQKNAERSFSPSFNAATVIDAPTELHTHFGTSQKVTQKTRLHAREDAAHSQKTKILVASPQSLQTGPQKTRISLYKIIAGSAIAAGLALALWSIWPKTPALKELPTVTNEPERQEQPIAALTATPVAPETPSEPESHAATQTPNPMHVGRLRLNTIPDTAQITVIANGQTLTSQGQLTKDFDFLTDTLPVKVSVAAPNYQTQTLEFEFSTTNTDLQKTITLEAVTYGTISVTSRPWAHFKIEGQSGKVYNTPGSVKLPTGRYTLRITAPSLDKTVSKPIVVKSGQTLSCRANFSETASVSCSY